MASYSARSVRPLIRLISRRLAAASTPDAARHAMGFTNRINTPVRGVTAHPTVIGRVEGLRIDLTGVSDAPVMLMFHGGGYVFGTPQGYQGLASYIAKASGATVYIPDYRLAPEHPHPAAIEDGLAAYVALLDQYPAQRIVIGGDSAGGGLTLAVAQAARDEGIPMPAALVMFSPWLDLTGNGVSHRSNADTEILVLPEIVARAADWYRGDVPADDPKVSPLFGDMSGLPPTQVFASANELLFSDSEAFVQAATDAEVIVDYHVEPDMWHVWPILAPMVREARESIERVGAFIGTHTS